MDVAQTRRKNDVVVEKFEEAFVVERFGDASEGLVENNWQYDHGITADERALQVAPIEVGVEQVERRVPVHDA